MGVAIRYLENPPGASYRGGAAVADAHGTLAERGQIGRAVLGKRGCFLGGQGNSEFNHLN